MISDEREIKQLCAIAERRLYSVAEAGVLLGRSKIWITQRVAAGELIGVRMPRLMINGPSINHFLKTRWV